MSALCKTRFLDRSWCRQHGGSAKCSFARLSACAMRHGCCARALKQLQSPPTWAHALRCGMCSTSITMCCNLPLRCPRGGIIPAALRSFAESSGCSRPQRSQSANTVLCWCAPKNRQSRMRIPHHDVVYTELEICLVVTYIIRRRLHVIYYCHRSSLVLIYLPRATSSRLLLHDSIMCLLSRRYLISSILTIHHPPRHASLCDQHPPASGVYWRG